MEKAEKFYKDGLCFECQRCSFCCGHSPGFVYLSWRDLDSLCAFFSLSRADFVEKYCRWADYYYGKKVLALREMKNYDCILWKDGCSAYEARPVQCSTWPFWSWIVESKESWQDCAKDCPGMNKGERHSFEEIDSAQKRYLGNLPIEREEFLKVVSE